MLKGSKEWEMEARSHKNVASLPVEDTNSNKVCSFFFVVGEKYYSHTLIFSF
jgi:hypothetical protein